MNFEKYLPELESLKNARQEKADKIKSHGLPVIIFGAAETARRVTNELARFGVQVDGYAVDVEYFKPDTIYLGKPVYNFAELLKKPDKFVFVLGMEDEAYGGVQALNFLVIVLQNFYLQIHILSIFLKFHLKQQDNH